MREIYLDNAATTMVSTGAAQAAMDLMTRQYGNPSSLHAKGIEAQVRLDEARQAVAQAMDVTRDEILFTGSGTQANNLAIIGAANALKRRGKGIVASSAEHASVLEALKFLETQGFTVTRIAPNTDGVIDTAAFLDAVDSDTILCTCGLVNSETGAIAPIAELVKRVKRKNKDTLFHCDAVQGFGKLAFSAKKLGVDLMSVSAHKIHAPKGCGALYIRRGVRVLPLFYGGGQEKNLSPGTENTPAICAFGYAAAQQAAELDKNLAHVRELREYFVNKAKTIEGLCMNSPPDASPYICNLSLPGWRSETMLHFLAGKGIFVSSGSACSKGAASYVLSAMALPRDRIDSALRVSFSRFNTPEDIDAFFAALTQGMLEIARSKR